MNNVVSKQHIIVGQLARGLPTNRTVKMKYILNSVRIRNSTALSTTGAISVKEFLIQCSHTAENYLDRKLNWLNELEHDDLSMDFKLFLNLKYK